MSARALRGAFFGKIGATGDFVWRGIEHGLRQRFDRWLCREIVPLSHAPWPPGGLRFTDPALRCGGLILQSADGAGRRFPLAALCPPHEAPTVDAFCETAWAPLEDAVAGRLDADALQAALAAIEPLDGCAPAAGFWVRDGYLEPTPGAAFSSA